MTAISRLFWALTVWTAAFSLSAFARDITIFDSHRSVALSDQERPPRDYYIGAGSEIGLRPGLIITVQRRSTLYDDYENRSVGDLVVPVGKVRIIQAQSGLSVGRFHSLIRGANAPALEDSMIMVGDFLDLSSVEIEKTEKVGEMAPPTPPPVAVTDPPVAKAPVVETTTPKVQ
jgi:hypothetical protein